MPAMALDRLTVINDALLETGNEQINALNDGSVEWGAASKAFDRAIKKLIAANVWDFSKTAEALIAAETNPSKRFSYAFVRPPSAWLITAVLWKTMPLPEYEVMGNRICANFQTDLNIEFVREPTDNEVPPWFQEVLTKAVEVSVLRSLNEDFEEAMRRESALMKYIREMASLENRQEPPRTGFAGRMGLARRSRRGGARRPAAGETFP